MSAVRRCPGLPESVTSPNGKLLVLYVQTCKAPTVERLCLDLGLSKLTVLTLLDDLTDRGVVRVDDGIVAMADGE